MRLGLLPKTVALLGVVALVPVVALTALLLDANAEAVKKSEASLQASVVSEITRLTVGTVEGAQRDAEAIAHALAEAARRDDKSDDPFSAVRLLLASRGTIDAVRFEVPQAKVSTVIRDEEVGRDVPESTPPLRAAADERGVGFELLDRERGALTVPIPRAPGSTGALGYVTVAVHVGDIEPTLTGLAEARFAGGGARILVVDADRRVIASIGTSLQPGADSSKLPIWARLPDGVPWARKATIVADHAEGAEPMVGVIESIPELKWGVALWRPRGVAYAQLSEMRRRGTMAVGLAVLLAGALGIATARRLARPIVALAQQARLIGARRWREVQVDVSPTDEIGDLGRSLDTMAKDLEASEEKIADEARLRGNLSRFLSRDLVASIVSGAHPLTLGGRRLPVTVLFADVVSFTPLAESKPPEEVVAILNELFSLLTEIVFRHEGTVDKFVGDSIMAVWGAPFASADHADKALAAAEDMLRFVEAANDGWREKYGVSIQLGVGVNTGEAVAGNIGSDKRMEYTVIGDAVNVAARLEAIAAPSQVLVSAATRDASTTDPPLELLGRKRLSGRSAEVEVYQLDVA